MTDRDHRKPREVFGRFPRIFLAPASGKLQAILPRLDPVRRGNDLPLGHETIEQQLRDEPSLGHWLAPQAFRDKGKTSLPFYLSTACAPRDRRLYLNLSSVRQVQLP